MGKNILIIAGNGFEDTELFATRDIFIRKGHEVEMAFETNDEFVKSSYGIKIYVDNKLEDVISKLKDYDALFIPGGPGIENIDYANKTSEIISHFVDSNKYIGAICAAPTILAKRGVLKDKKSICYPDKSLQTIMIKNGANLVSTKCNFDEECSVVVDGKIITGLDMKTSIKFGEIFSKEILK